MVLNTPTVDHWVLLRGLTREAAHWGHFPAVLRQALPGTQLHLLDLPGNGLRHRERSPSTVAAMVSDLREQLQQRAIAAPVHVLALSLGAMVAVEWARSAPQEVAGAVLINTSLRPFSPPHQRLRPRQYTHLVRLVLGRLSAEEAEREVFRITCNHPAGREADIRRWVQARQLRPVDAGNALRQLWAASRYRAPWRAPATPLLLLGSTQDRLVSHRCSEAIAQAWGCPLRTHPCAGHDLTHDDPHWVARQVQDWIAPRPG